MTATGLRPIVRQTPSAASRITTDRYFRPIILENAVLLEEALARARMREDQRVARDERLARRLTAARRWSRLARYAGRRASRARDGL